MRRESFDVMISGGGVAGLTAAAVFGALGLRTLCVDPTPPTVEEGDPAADLRTTAFLQPAIDLLTRAGLWERLAPFAAPLSIMRIVDAGGAQTIPRLTRDFDSADISDQPFGWNLPNWLLRREMVARLGEMQNVAFRTGVATAGVLTRTEAALIMLSDGSQVSARLLVAADGRNSAVREALAIPVRRISYGQKALAFAVTHPVPHGGISTEVHRSGGPFTLVPLPDREGRPASAVVWMESGPEALRLSRLPVEEFEAAATERSAEVLGPLRLITRRSLWPIISQRAERMTAERVALVAEAAHVVPPIGAQGLNMSLADIATLADLAAADPAGLGGVGMLHQFAQQRERDVHLRQAGIDLLNRASMVSSRPLRDLRAAALGAFYSAGPVRKTLMRAGLGAGKPRD
ncbi:2-octaprenyl-6-methoxyphenyl hydroxylase [Haematobacter missouriensis]|uniref:2-octaprenyl-6-methoxyphenyl hydroxylase n=1 Tax=Haematobacter missouriensis TaxID=366616 RepID=A0A212AVI7_9RHOB|nr:UbiH/UbiF family hydroxylase [Haematobacter missouriensis]KFI33561.1 2-octaprenyl-6-methoxyphenyl hydroxylase [Haematobacter missouriensis]OWJ79229.1 2-octaprenyl-6-methoxyphenyl hydroxylase [Haematobacter missouriensis]OWJ85502.1 2-octaprenyl-6-methoxyphenyl hydroxylase [Haematobacter missouriensis]